MDLAAWDQKYRKQADSARERGTLPDSLLVHSAGPLSPGRALDLACGTGTNALWLTQQGWSVTAVDGSPTAIAILRNRAVDSGATIDTQVADLEKRGFTIAPSSYDLIVMSYYFQRSLVEMCKRGLVPGGVMIVVALLMVPGKELSTFRLQPGELRGYFPDWEILHYREAVDLWGHSVVELVARRSRNEPS